MQNLLENIVKAGFVISRGFDIKRFISTLVDQLFENWNKFWEKNIKKGAKDARKDTLTIKKKASEIRAAFKDLDI